MLLFDGDKILLITMQHTDEGPIRGGYNVNGESRLGIPYRQASPPPLDSTKPKEDSRGVHNCEADLVRIVR